MGGGSSSGAGDDEDSASSSAGDETRESSADTATATSRGEGSKGTPTDADTAFADGGAPGFDEERLHAVVRDAVEDAILGAVGTLLLVGIGLLFFWGGLTAIADANTGDAGVVGALMMIVGLALVVGTLHDMLPTSRWF